ncbi:MAG: ROK family protein [Anaerolineae bacterium]|nr:ROK family protein [Anaerolineae bacterium]
MTTSSQTTEPWFIGVDVGGTKISTLLVDKDFNEHTQLTVATDLTNPDYTLTGIIAAIEKTLARAGLRRSEIAALGMGVPGQVDPQEGVVNLAANLNWYDFPAGELLAGALSIPCFLENDVRAAAWGAYRLGNHPGLKHLAYINIGTGVAAGLILDGQLYRGAHGMAGEIGHMVVEPEGLACKCGAQGCLETIVAGPAVARAGQEAARQRPDSLLAGCAPLTTQHVYDAAQAGDAAALEVTNRVGQVLGRALQAVVMSYDVERIILGGGVTHAGQPFLQPILAAWQQLRHSSPLAQALLKPDMLVLADPTRNMGAWGAAALAERSFSQT